jgi:replication factor A1
MWYFGGLDLMYILRNSGDGPSRDRKGGRKSKSNKDALHSIALIAQKYELDPGVLLDAFKRAWINGKSQCGVLKIESREADQNTFTFLVTLNDEVICQFLIDTNILEKTELFKSSIPVVSVPILRKHSGQRRIGELRAKMRGVSVTARVLEVPPKELVYSRYGGKSYVSNILLADETGTIRLSLWNRKIDDVAVGDTVKIEKATVVTFHGKLQLRIGRGGTMSVDASANEESILIEN